MVMAVSLIPYHYLVFRATKKRRVAKGAIGIEPSREGLVRQSDEIGDPL